MSAPKQTSFTFDELKQRLDEYIYSLANAADHLEKHRGESAYVAIVATTEFLKSIGLGGREFGPLVEAAGIIHEQLEPYGLKRERTEKIFRAVALKLLVESGVSEAEALQKIVGNDRAAAATLKNFTKAMLRRDSRYPREKKYYYDSRAHLKKFYPDNAPEQALGTCRMLRGKEV
jgi:hypothetical protein